MERRLLMGQVSASPKRRHGAERGSGAAPHPALRLQRLIGNRAAGKILAKPEEKDFAGQFTPREKKEYLEQLECVKRLGGCSQTRPGGIPTEEEIEDYNRECRQESGYPGPKVEPSEEECRGEVREESAAKLIFEPASLTPLKTGGDPGSKLVVYIAWSFDDGPTSVTARMEKKVAGFGGTWFIQRHLLEKGDKKKNLEELGKKQATGQEFAIHSMHPSKSHVSWFPSSAHDAYGDIDSALGDLRSFYAELTGSGLRINFVRLPYGLITELKEYLEMLGNEHPAENAARIINPEKKGTPEGIGVAQVQKDLLKMKISLRDLGLLLWGGAAGGEVSPQSWEAESSGVSSREDTVTSHITFQGGRKYSMGTFEKVVDQTVLDKKRHSLVVLAHDTTEADVAEVGADVEKMESYAKEKKVRIEYYTMSQLYRLIVR